jgi:single-strand DNA-binding protein
MYNNCTLIGRLARDPEYREFSGGAGICKLRLITTQSWRDKSSGEIKERADGHNVTIYVPGLAQRIFEKATKGDTLFVVGLLETRRWTAEDGQVRYITEVSVRPYQGSVRRIAGSSQSGRQQPALANLGEAPLDQPQDHVTSVEQDVFDDWLSSETGGGFDLSDFDDADGDL